jgi:hypothetical protein
LPGAVTQRSGPVSRNQVSKAHRANNKEETQLSKSDTQMATRLQGHTTLSPQRVHELASATARGLKKGGFKLDEAGRADDNTPKIALKSTGLGYGLRGINAAGTQGSVTVFVGDEGAEVPEGTRAVMVHMGDGAQTSQQVVGGFVPVSRKSVVGFGLYTAYLQKLQPALRDADPDGEFEIRSDEIA